MPVTASASGPISMSDVNSYFGTSGLPISMNDWACRQLVLGSGVIDQTNYALPMGSMRGNQITSYINMTIGSYDVGPTTGGEYIIYGYQRLGPAVGSMNYLGTPIIATAMKYDRNHNEWFVDQLLSVTRDYVNNYPYVVLDFTNWGSAGGYSINKYTNQTTNAADISNIGNYGWVSLSMTWFANGGGNYTVYPTSAWSSKSFQSNNMQYIVNNTNFFYDVGVGVSLTIVFNGIN
mgnify:CR=1 FL=1